MTKAEIIEDIQTGLKDRQNIEVTKAQVEAVIDDFFGLVIDRASDGQDTKYPAIGTFKSANQAARGARNLHTGEKIQVPAKTVLKLAVSAPAKKLVNGS